jgi:FlaA1/EpsC-like NDP-sugar epimerase
MKGKRILVTGGAGSIGSELVRQLVPHNKVFVFDNNETGVVELCEEFKHKYWIRGTIGDVRDAERVEDVFSDFKPQVVFHAAALKHVSPAEMYPREYVDTNIIGTLNVIKYAKRWECLEKFVFVSTDKAVQSSSIMGATKRVSEIITRNQGRGFVVVRFGNVLGSRGSVIPLWQKAIDKGEALKVTDERMTRYMMTIQQAVELVIHAAEEGDGGEIFVLDMGEKVNVLNLAESILASSGREHAGVEMIGMRPGEQLTEKLMFEEEEKIAIKNGKFFVIKV